MPTIIMLLMAVMSDGRLCLNDHDPGNHNQQWQYNKHRDVIENRVDPNKVMDVVGASTDNGAEVCSENYNGRDSQRWTVEHLLVPFCLAKHHHISRQRFPAFAINISSITNGSACELYVLCA